MQSTIARIESQIDAHYDAPIRHEISPHSSDSKAKKASYAARLARWNEQLDAMTAELRAAKMVETEPFVRVFPQDIENARAAEAFTIAKQRQLDGLLRSFRQ